MALKLLFFQKIAKKLPSSWGFGPKPPSVMLLSKLVCLHTSPNLHIFIFNFWFKLLPFENSSLIAKPGHGFWSYILRYPCPPKSKFLFQKFLMTSLHVIFGLALHPIKNSGHAYARGGGGGGGGGLFGPCPPNHCLCLPSESNFYTSTRGPANFCPKTDHHKCFFSMKQQDRSSERDQVA